MAGTISLAGAAEVLPSPVGSSPNRTVAPRAGIRGARVQSAAEQHVAATREQPTQNSRYASAVLEQARSAGLANHTTLMFERDIDDGKIYLYIKDKRTGDEVIRIPKKQLEPAGPKEVHGHRVDVRI